MLGSGHHHLETLIGEFFLVEKEIRARGVIRAVALEPVQINQGVLVLAPRQQHAGADVELGAVDGYERHRGAAVDGAVLADFDSVPEF